jgi:flagellar hook-basal body complex protein FliE
MASVNAIGSASNLAARRALAGSGLTQAGPGQGPAPGDGPTFADTLQKALGEVSELQDRSQDTIGAFLRGEPVEMHEVMAAAEEAGIALEMVIEFRNKLTEAYRSVMQMQT